MIMKNDCVELANRLISELELDRQPIANLPQIDGEFIWLIIEKVFNTNLLPKWKSLDCLDETEEFQFIFQTLEQIFDLNLDGINPAYLTLRKPEYIYLVLNALSLANHYIKSKREDKPLDLSEIFGRSSDASEEDESNDDEESSIDELSDTLIDSSIDLSSSTSDTSNLNALKHQLKGKSATESKKVEKSYQNTSSSLFSDESSSSVEASEKEKKLVTAVSHSEEKKIKDEQLKKQLNELKDNKKLIYDFTYKKEQNFALEISYKILDVMKIQQRTKQIKTNLNKIQNYEDRMKSLPATSQANQNKNQSKIKRSNNNLKNKGSFIGKQQTFKRQPPSKPFDLGELLDKLSGLSSNQLSELKSKTDHQNQLISQVKSDLIQTERRLQSQMLTKIEKENKLLELLQKDLNLNLNLSAIAKNRNERKQLKQAKYELRRERAEFKRGFDEYYQINLSKMKNLETEQEQELRELARKNDHVFRQDLQRARKEIREYELQMKENQQQLLDNYDNFYLTQSMLIQQEINRQTHQTSRKKSANQIDSNNSLGLVKQLERSFTAKLYPKFN